MRSFALLMAVAALAAAGERKPRPGLAWAPSWDAAVEEARALNLPIVVHRHGFY